LQVRVRDACDTARAGAIYNAMYNKSIHATAADGCALHAERSGTGDPDVVLLHGFGDGGFVWQDFMLRAGTTGLLVPDLRGHGQSGWDASGGYHIDTHAADIVHLVEQLSLQPAVVVGHSLGASIAIRAATALPQLRGLVIVDGGPTLNREAVRHLHERFRGQPWRYSSREVFLEGLRDRLPQANETLLQHFTDAAIRSLPDGAVELRCDPALSLLPDYDDSAVLREQLARVRCPVLLIRGAWSAMLTRAGVESLQRDFNSIRVHTIARAGHTVMLENPSDFFSVVQSFLHECGVVRG
jgi:pimeloyl-ACP methyl ester carboxylesterase